jgi:CBS domain-containing protein
MQTIKTFLERSPKSLHTVQNNQTVWEALDIMATNNIGALPVLSGESMVGIFSERDYARRVELKGKQTRETLIQDVMTAEFITVSPEQKMDECMQIMTDMRIRHLPVMNDNKIIGMVSIGDVLFVMIAEQRHLINQLHTYISG